MGVWNTLLCMDRVPYQGMPRQATSTSARASWHHPRPDASTVSPASVHLASPDSVHLFSPGREEEVDEGLQELRIVVLPHGTLGRQRKGKKAG